MKNIWFFAYCLMLGMMILFLSSCGNTQASTTETGLSTTAITTTEPQTATSTLESAPTLSLEDPDKQAARAETLSRLKRYDEETENLSRFVGGRDVVEYFKRSRIPTDKNACNCFLCNMDAGEYIPENNVLRIKECEGVALDDVIELLPQPLFTCYTRYHDWSIIIPGASTTYDIITIFEVKTLYMTEDGKVLEITFKQEYENYSPSYNPRTLEEVIPKGFKVETVKEYTCDEITQIHYEFSETP